MNSISSLNTTSINTGSVRQNRELSWTKANRENNHFSSQLSLSDKKHNNIAFGFSIRRLFNPSTSKVKAPSPETKIITDKIESVEELIHVVQKIAPEIKDLKFENKLITGITSQDSSIVPEIKGLRLENGSITVITSQDSSIAPNIKGLRPKNESTIAKTLQIFSLEGVKISFIPENSTGRNSSFISSDSLKLLGVTGMLKLEKTLKVDLNKIDKIIEDLTLSKKISEIKDSLSSDLKISVDKK